MGSDKLNTEANENRPLSVLKPDALLQEPSQNAEDEGCLDAYITELERKLAVLETWVIIDRMRRGGA